MALFENSKNLFLTYVCISFGVSFSLLCVSFLVSFWVPFGCPWWKCHTLSFIWVLVIPNIIVKFIRSQISCPVTVFSTMGHITLTSGQRIGAIHSSPSCWSQNISSHFYFYLVLVFTAMVLFLYLQFSSKINLLLKTSFKVRTKWRFNPSFQ